MLVDLHSHTNLSDGTLSPQQLLDAAACAGIELFAITDHDTLAAYETQLDIPDGLTLVKGIEFSTTWRKTGVHIVGLNVDATAAAIQEGVANQTLARKTRALQIAEKLEKLGVEEPLAGARRFANGEYLGRPHFAQHLVASGVVSNLNQAFKRYLGSGKPGDIKQHWASLEQVTGWIRDSGGIAVLAHPLKYNLTLSKLRELLDDFIGLGGHAMEVVSGLQSPSDTRTLSQLCQAKGLLASTGSDFHMPGQSWGKLGAQSPLPVECTPVWQMW